ncbi:MAG: hypothetical protein IKK13_02410 [Clostridia bacterium]|jgi:hypothetical protein|nr:hypothetical protein [Clostridia bacterium]
MEYGEILKALARKHNKSEKEIENEMKIALCAAGVKATPRQFIEATAALVKK